jgi:subtilase family serine protease
MKNLRAPAAGQVLFGLAVAVVLVFAAGAGAARPVTPPANPLADTHQKAVCTSAPATVHGPAARCAAWALARSGGHYAHVSGRLVRRHSVVVPGASPNNTTASPDSNVVQPMWPGGLETAYQSPGETAGSHAQTVAIVDAFDNPNVKSDLDTYDSFWGLPSLPTCANSSSTSCFAKVNQTGSFSGPYPSFNAGWALEISLDVEAVHSVCFDCRILLVEANTNAFSNLSAATNEAAALGANVISNSYGGAESGIDQSTFDTFAPSYRHSGVIIVASSGDDAFAAGAQFPADVNDVVAVGGTTLTSDFDTGAWAGETVWNGAGSGCSAFETPHPWQPAASGWTAAGCGSRRGVADVAADANPDSGLYVWNTVSNPCTNDPNDQFDPCWYVVGGTSLAAPIIAAMYALAANPGAVASPDSLPYAHFRSLHDVRAGTNGSCASTICKGAVGYDGPTGMGTPNGLFGFSIGEPNITSFSPSAGPAGTTIAINGSGFTQASAVTIGLTPVQSFTVDSDIKITAVAGNGTTGTIRVTTPGGTGQSGTTFFSFAPIITSFTPNGGGTGTSVTITGTGFGGATAVKFGGINAASYTVDSDTQITATTAAGTVTGPISVVGFGGVGTSSTVFYGPPSISSLSPTSGGEHSTVTVTGTNLTGASSVKLSGHTASFSVVSPTQITFVAPTGATTGTVQVTTPGGIATSGSFTVLGPPTITSFTPGSGPVGTPVTITGTNLGDVVGVSIGTTITVPTSVSPTQVVFSIPPGAATGAIRLLARNGSVTSLATFTVTS